VCSFSSNSLPTGSFVAINQNVPKDRQQASPVVYISAEPDAAVPPQRVQFLPSTQQSTVSKTMRPPAEPHKLRPSPLPPHSVPTATCHTLLPNSPTQFNAASHIKRDILLWSIVLPIISLALFARSRFIAFHQAPAAPFRPDSQVQPFYRNLPIAQLLLGCHPRCLTTLILSAACTAAILLAPSWYREGGREQLLATGRLLPKAVTLLQLLLPVTHPLGGLQRVWLQTCAVGVKGLLALMIWPVLFPVSAATANLRVPQSGQVCGCIVWTLVHLKRHMF
jgi:hypothetical protein